MPYSYIKTEVMRQLCFMFGLPSEGRDDTLTDKRGAVYCENTCVLRPAQLAPADWQELTSDRMKYGPLCEPCLQELRRFFESCAEESG